LTNAGKNQGKRNSSTLLVGMSVSAMLMESSIGVFKQSKTITTVLSRVTTPGHIPNQCAPGYDRASYTPMFIAALFIIAKPDGPQLINGLRKCGIYTQWSLFSHKE
jgi:hypothetical protein